MQEWRLVFWITVAVLVVTNFAFVFMASGEVQPWNEPRNAASETKNGEPKKLPEDKVGNTLEIEPTTPQKSLPLITQLETFRYLPES